MKIYRIVYKYHGTSLSIKVIANDEFEAIKRIINLIDKMNLPLDSRISIYVKKIGELENE